MWRSIQNHWSEYAIEAAGLGLFMISAGVCGVLLEYPGSPVRQSIDDPFLRRVLMGIAMGITAITIIYSPWGRRSGAHLNPAVTLTFFRLGKVAGWDAAFYTAAQFVGGVAGVAIALALFRGAFANPPVNYVATLPGPAGNVCAFLAEAAITFVLMMVVLITSNIARLSRYTGLCCGALLAVYIAFEAPISGMSLNPARSFASALPGGVWNGLWIYFTAPVLGMLLAAEIYVRTAGAHRVFCAKLNHAGHAPCIFRCRHNELLALAAADAGGGAIVPKQGGVTT